MIYKDREEEGLSERKAADIDIQKLEKNRIDKEEILPKERCLHERS
jgi:hypothetical protein